MIKVLITGGAGFIGSHLADWLYGNDITVVDDLSGGSVENLSTNVNFIKCDLRDREEVNNIISYNKPDLIYHLAANAAEGKSHYCPIDIVTRNYNTFLNVLVAGINYGLKRFILVSSVAVYGSIEPPFKESDTPHPEDLYGLSKLHAEESLRILSKVHRFEYAIARAHNVYGPRQSMTDPYRNVVMIWMNKILKGEPYVIYGDGSMERCYTYVEDLVNGLGKLGFTNADKEIFNMGADEPISLKQLSDAVQEVSGHIVPPTFLPMRAQETKLAVLDHSKSKRILGYQTKTNLLEGIGKTWEWAKAHGPQDFRYTDFEIESDKIPANWRK